jgi:ubiquinone biosynthesis UbiH/UbiF/VisC/COQ6 family hydroxylase
MALNVDICIRGGGVVGSTLALLLSRLNLSVALVSSVSPAQSSQAADIRAYAFNGKSKSILESINAWPDEAFCTEVQQMRIHSDKGERIEFSNNQERIHHHEALSWIVEVSALESKLSKTLQTSRVQRVSFDPGAEVEPIKAPLTVICEGGKSASKLKLHTQSERYGYAQNALATRIRLNNLNGIKQSHSGIAYQWFNTANSLDHKSNEALEILALLPIGGEDGDTFAVVWSTSPARNKVLSALPHDEFSQALSSSTRGLFQDLIPSEDRQSWPLTYTNTQAWCGTFNERESWVLCGDSAHTIHPLAGMGLNLGLADANVLYELMLERERNTGWRSLNDLRMLKAYERQRKLSVYPFVQFVDKVQRLFASDYALAGFIRNQGFKTFNAFGPLKEWTIRKAMQISS